MSKQVRIFYGYQIPRSLYQKCIENDQVNKIATTYSCPHIENKPNKQEYKGKYCDECGVLVNIFTHEWKQPSFRYYLLKYGKETQMLETEDHIYLTTNNDHNPINILTTDVFDYKFILDLIHRNGDNKIKLKPIIDEAFGKIANSIVYGLFGVESTNVTNVTNKAIVYSLKSFY